METRITARLPDSPDERNCRSADVHPIGEILEELLAQYQARFPGIRIAVVETAVNAL